MPETLKRIYHGLEVSSTRNEHPVADSDGWSHEVGDRVFPTLADAIRFARNPEPSQQAETASPPTSRRRKAAVRN